MAGFEQAYRFSERLRDFPVEARPLIKAVMKEAGEQGQAYSKMLVPVKSGDLMRSIAFRGTSERGWSLLMKAEATVDYATFVEFGTSRMAPRPFLMPGVELAADVIDDQLGFIMRGL